MDGEIQFKKCYQCGDSKFLLLARLQCSTNSATWLDGHDRRDCTYDERVCFNCKKPGHQLRGCPMPRATSRKCFNCGQTGHMRAQCPLRSCYVSRY